MSGVGSTNAMKKGSANNPFLAFSEADMASYLNSAYTGCIVKYSGDAINREVSDTNKTVGEYAQNIVFNLQKDGRFGMTAPQAIKIDITNNGSSTTQYIYDAYVKDNKAYPTEVTGSVPMLVLAASMDAGADVVATLCDSTGQWQKSAVNDQGKVTLWAYSEDVLFTVVPNAAGSIDIFKQFFTIVPYIVGELYKVVYGNGQYYYEEFYYISEERTTGNSDYLAPGKTMYDFTGSLQTGNGSKINPYIANTVDEMNSYLTIAYREVFIKYVGASTDDYTKNAIYQVLDDGDTTRYAILPTLENEGTASDLAAGKQLINSQGEVVVGELEKVINYLPLLVSNELEEIPFVALKDVIKIPEYTFYNKTNLKTINIPSTVKAYSSNVTTGCTNLTKINIESLKAWLQSTFESSMLVQAKHLYVNDVVLTAITKNDTEGITKISASAFNNCSDLVTVELADSVETLGANVFSSCTKLTSFSAKSLTKIPERCFENVKLVSIYVPNVTDIRGEYSMGKGFINANLEFPLVTTVGQSAFYYCKAKSMSFPSLVNEIASFTFYHNSNLEFINLPLMEEMPKAYFMDNCTKIKQIVLPKLKTFRIQGIDYCTALKIIDLPSVTDVANYSSYAFRGMSNVKLLLRYNGIVTLSASQLPNAITEIYVPNDQVDNYKADTKWSVYADKIKSLDDYVEPTEEA